MKAAKMFSYLQFLTLTWRVQSVFGAWGSTIGTLLFNALMASAIYLGFYLGIQSTPL